MDTNVSTLTPSIKEEDDVNKSNNRLGACEVCAAKDAKYTCPKCEVKTCRLECLKIHKFEFECDGIRDRTKYIHLKDFTDSDLSSDYRLLEEVGREVDKHRKELRKINQQYIPKHLFLLKKAAEARGTYLRLLPQAFARHKNNKTRYCYATKIINWTVEWVFPNADNLVLVDENVSEKEKLGTVLSKHFGEQEDKVLQEKLQFYQYTGLNKITLLLKAERKGKDKFFELDKDEYLMENLKRKLIIEYPTIYVVPDYQIDNYDVLNSGDEEDHYINPKRRKETMGENVCRKRIKRKTSTNFLFAADSDLSDEEVKMCKN